MKTLLLALLLWPGLALGAASDAKPLVIKNAAYRWTFSLFSGTSLAPGATSLVCKRNCNGGAFATCTGTVTEETLGAYHLDMTAAELNCATVVVLVTSSADPIAATITPATSTGEQIPVSIVTASITPGQNQTASGAILYVTQGNDYYDVDGNFGYHFTSDGWPSLVGATAIWIEAKSQGTPVLYWSNTTGCAITTATANGIGQAAECELSAASTLLLTATYYTYSVNVTLVSTHTKELLRGVILVSPKLH